MLRVLDLFSGIGGFSLGLERTGGFKTVAFCEIDPFCRRVLAKHWPDVPCYDDVRALTADALERDGIAVDVICGGFPCQDISHAGKRAGLEGARSGLWREYARIIGELRPRFVIVENVAGLLSLGLGDVLGDLAALGYDATWECIPASAVGAPHRRDRIWIVAYANRSGRDANSEGQERHEGHAFTATVALCEPGIRAARSADVAHAAGDGRQISGTRDEGRNADAARQRLRNESGGDSAGDGARALADATRIRSAEHAQSGANDSETACARAPLSGGSRFAVADANCSGLSDGRQTREPTRSSEAIGGVAQPEPQRCGGAWWAIEPDVGRVANGVPSRVDRLRSLGNAVVPQIPELIGRAILAAERAV